MCTITGTCNLKEFTGYKVALKINGKYYSPVTGGEILVSPSENRINN